MQVDRAVGQWTHNAEDFIGAQKLNDNNNKQTRPDE